MQRVKHVKVIFPDIVAPKLRRLVSANGNADVSAWVNAILNCLFGGIVAYCLVKLVSSVGYGILSFL